MTMSNLRRAFKTLCKSTGLGDDWTTYELRHSFVSLVSDQLDDLVKVADLAGHVDTRTTEGYRHSVRPALPHAVDLERTTRSSTASGLILGGGRTGARCLRTRMRGGFAPEPPGPGRASANDLRPWHPRCLTGK